MTCEYIDILRLSGMVRIQPRQGHVIWAFVLILLDDSVGPYLLWLIGRWEVKYILIKSTMIPTRCEVYNSFKEHPSEVFLWGVT